MDRRFDILLIGGGLQNALVALALAQQFPSRRVGLVERSTRLGGNHLWCFHAADVPDDAAAFVAPLVIRRWPGYDVRFPDRTRALDEVYAAVSSERLHETISGLASGGSNLTLFLGDAAVAMADGSVHTSSGHCLRADVVVDARGPEALALSGNAGFQKFLGLELEVRPDTLPARPMLMDACVVQRDGFRFFYVLPLTERSVLVEDTYFSESSALDRDALRAEVLNYARQSGLAVLRTLREETGVLPLPTRRTIPKEPRNGWISAGYQGGWFHPTTGYSFPLAVRFAREVARTPLADLEHCIRRLVVVRDRQQRFCTLLNRLLFDAFEPEQRFRVFERFYALPSATIRRFYALEMTTADRARILCGRPPRGFSASRLLTQRAVDDLTEPAGDDA